RYEKPLLESTTLPASDDANLKHIFNDHSSADMDFSEFRKISHFCWNYSDYGFMVIDKTREMNEVYKYSCNSDKIYVLKETDILNSLFSMNIDKVLLKNLVLSKKNIKRKIMNMKSVQFQKKNTSFISNTTKNKDILITSDGDSENKLTSSFDNFFISNPKLQRIIT
ncbi:tigger transposable element-derived protein 4-like, partial [Aphis craccivora]